MPDSLFWGLVAIGAILIFLVWRHFFKISLEQEQPPVQPEIPDLDARPDNAYWL